MKLSMPTRAFLFGGCVVLGGCWPNPSADDQGTLSDDSKIAFDRGEGATNGGTTGIGGPGTHELTMCDILGPHSTLVLLRMEENPELHKMAPGCDPADDPYASQYFEMDVEVLETVTGPSPPTSMNLKLFWNDYHPVPELASGPLMLAALRKSNGEWFLDTFLYITRAGGSTGVTPREPSDDIGLPAQWGELKQRAQTVAADYAPVCGNERSGYAPTYFFYDDQEYYDLRFVRNIPKPDCASHHTTNNSTNGSLDTNGNTNDND